MSQEKENSSAVPLVAIENAQRYLSKGIQYTFQEQREALLARDALDSVRHYIEELLSEIETLSN